MHGMLHPDEMGITKEQQPVITILAFAHLEYGERLGFKEKSSQSARARQEIRCDMRRPLRGS